MGWFSIVSILFFVYLIVRVIIKILNNTPGRIRNYILVVIFSIHIAVIIYFSLD